MAQAHNFPPAINGTEQRLDAVLEELRALRELLATLGPQPPNPTALREGSGKQRRTSKKDAEHDMDE